MRASERCRTNDPNVMLHEHVYFSKWWRVASYKILFLKVLFFLLYVTRVTSVYMYVCRRYTYMYWRYWRYCLP